MKKKLNKISAILKCPCLSYSYNPLSRCRLHSWELKSKVINVKFLISCNNSFLFSALVSAVLSRLTLEVMELIKISSHSTCSCLRLHSNTESWNNINNKMRRWKIFFFTLSLLVFSLLRPSRVCMEKKSPLLFTHTPCFFASLSECVERRFGLYLKRELQCTTRRLDNHDDDPDRETYMKDGRHYWDRGWFCCCSSMVQWVRWEKAEWGRKMEISNGRGGTVGHWDEA